MNLNGKAYGKKPRKIARNIRTLKTFEGARMENCAIGWDKVQWLNLQTASFLSTHCSRKTVLILSKENVEIIPHSQNAGYRGTRWRQVVNFTPQLLYPRKNSQYPLNRRLGGPHNNQSGHFGEAKNLLHFPGFEPQTTQPIAYSLLCSIWIWRTVNYCKILMTTPGAHRTSDSYKSYCKEKLDSTSDSCCCMVVWWSKSYF